MRNSPCIAIQLGAFMVLLELTHADARVGDRSPWVINR